MRCGEKMLRMGEGKQVKAGHWKVRALATIAAGVDGTLQSRFVDRSLKREQCKYSVRRCFPFCLQALTRLSGG
jgi:hypothetical protein